MNQIFDLAILGGGPAGVSAGVYASRKRLKTIFLTKDFGGQSSVSTEIQNWIGFPKISGQDLAESMKKHLLTYAGDIVDVKEGAEIKRISKAGNGFNIETSVGNFESKTILIATGSRRRRLEVPGADKFEHRGVTYCASCDGPIFADMDVAVIGGGNAGFETAAQLLAYCKSVTLLNRSEEFKADPATVSKVLSNPKMKAVTNTDILEVLGDRSVEGLVYLDKKSGQKITLPVHGVFVEIGSVPSTDFASEVIERDKFGHIIVDPNNQRTSALGIWAAGDCTNGLYHQNNIAAGDGVKALEDIYMHLHAK